PRTPCQVRFPHSFRIGLERAGASVGHVRRLVPMLAFLSLLAAGPASAGLVCGDETQNIEPSFSLDGSKLVFVSGDEGGCTPFGALELAGSNGGRPTQLTPDGAVAAAPRLSPDGSLVAFTARPP